MRLRLIVTQSGHDAIPIDPYNKILTNVVSGINLHVALIATDNTKIKSNVALKFQ